MQAFRSSLRMMLRQDESIEPLKYFSVSQDDELFHLNGVD
jgi:hypothetical protein